MHVVMAKMQVVFVVVLAFARPDALATAETEPSEYDEEFEGAISLAATAGPVCASRFISRCLGTNPTNQQKQLCRKVQDLCDELIKVPGVAKLREGCKNVTPAHHGSTLAAADKLLQAQLKLNAGLKKKLQDVAGIFLLAMPPSCAKVAKAPKDSSATLGFGTKCIEPLLLNGAKESPAVQDEAWLGLMITLSFSPGVLPATGSSASMQASTENTVPTEELSDNLHTAAARGHRQQLWWGHHHVPPPHHHVPTPPTPTPTRPPTRAPTPAPYSTPYTSDSIKHKLLTTATGGDAGLNDLRAAAWHSDNVANNCNQLNSEFRGDGTTYSRPANGDCVTEKDHAQITSFPGRILRCKIGTPDAGTPKVQADCMAMTQKDLHVGQKALHQVLRELEKKLTTMCAKSVLRSGLVQAAPLCGALAASAKLGVSLPTMGQAVQGLRELAAAADVILHVLKTMGISLQVQHGVQRYISQHKTEKKAVVAFRGTDHPWDWLSNFEYTTVNLNFPEYPENVRVQYHKGIHDMYQLQRQNLLKRMKELFKKGVKHWIITGHSQGAALAQLCAYDLANMVFFSAPGYTKKTSSYVKHGKCASKVFPCDANYEKCKQQAFAACTGSCVAVQVKKLGGNEFVTYTQTNCVRTNIIHPDIHWDLYMNHVAQPLSVTSGSQYCQIDSKGCATDGSGNHGNNEACTIQVNVAGSLTATEFHTEAGYDFVTIAGTKYAGTNGPKNLRVAAYTTFSWKSDHSVTKSGWTICLTPAPEKPVDLSGVTISVYTFAPPRLTRPKYANVDGEQIKPLPSDFQARMKTLKHIIKHEAHINYKEDMVPCAFFGWEKQEGYLHWNGTVGGWSTADACKSGHGKGTADQTARGAEKQVENYFKSLKRNGPTSLGDHGMCFLCNAIGAICPNFAGCKSGCQARVYGGDKQTNEFCPAKDTVIRGFKYENETQDMRLGDWIIGERNREGRPGHFVINKPTLPQKPQLLITMGSQVFRANHVFRAGDDFRHTSVNGNVIRLGDWVMGPKNSMHFVISHLHGTICQFLVREDGWLWSSGGIPPRLHASQSHADQRSMAHTKEIPGHVIRFGKWLVGPKDDHHFVFSYDNMVKLLIHKNGIAYYDDDIPGSAHHTLALNGLAR